MTATDDKKLSTQQRDELKAKRKQLEHALNETIEDTIREAAVPNALAWIGVVVGSFLINLLLLIIVAG